MGRFPRRANSYVTALALISAVAAINSCTVDFSDNGTPDSEVPCGNGVIDPEEECDGDNLANLTCEDLNFDGGELTCNADCTLNVTTCIGCGNGVLDGDEQCDNGALNSDAVPNACRTDCTAARCGDDVADSDELCDGPDLTGSSCELLGFDGGELRCGPGCGFDTSDCVNLDNCGNATVDAGEDCDGADLAGQTCSLLGFPGGTLACDALCRFDTTGCIQHIGGPCMHDSDCQSGLCLTEEAEGFPGGYCTSDCMADSCPGGETCVEFSGTIKFCMVSCTDSTECRTGYACFGNLAMGHTLCWPHCETFNHCPTVQSCNLWTGMCVQVTPAGAENGSSCSDGGDCRSAVCEDPWPGPLGGDMCVSSCNVQTGVCPAGDVCSNVYGGTRADLGLCLQSCQSVADCYSNSFSCVSNPWGAGDICRPSS
jgi:hypothetical protein